MRRAATAIVIIAVAGCSQPTLRPIDYRDVVAERSASYAEEAEQIRSIHLFELERAVDGLVKDLQGDALQAAAVAETARRSAILFASIADAVQRYAVDLAEMEVPDPLRPAHGEYIGALQLSISGVGVTIDALTGASSFEEIDAAIGGSTFNDTQHRVDAACVALEQALDEAGASGDLHCRDG